MINLAEIDKDNVKTRYDLMSDDQKALQNSEARNFLLFKTALVELNKPFGSDSATLTVSHKLGYVPAVMVYFAQTAQGTTSYIPIPFSTIVAETFFESLSASATDTDLTIGITYQDPIGIAPSPDITLTFRYYIFREKAN